MHQDWRVATGNTSEHLEQNVKEPHNLLFFKGVIYEITFNVEGKFRNTQLDLLFYLTSEDDLSNRRKLKVLKYVVGKKYVNFEPNLSKEDCIHRGFE